MAVSYYYDRHSRKKILLDDFGEEYFAASKEDKCKNIGIALPESLIKIIDQMRGPIPRSRFVRKIIEIGLEVERVSKIKK